MCSTSLAVLRDAKTNGQAFSCQTRARQGSFQACARRSAQRAEGAAAGIARRAAELFLDAEELVVLGDPVGARGGSGLDLAAVAGHRQIRDGGVLGLARAVAHHAGVA